MSVLDKDWIKKKRAEMKKKGHNTEEECCDLCDAFDTIADRDDTIETLQARGRSWLIL